VVAQQSIRYEPQCLPECKGWQCSGQLCPWGATTTKEQVMADKRSNTVKPLVAGNWKMNGLRASIPEFDRICAGAAGAAADVLICPPATLVATLADAAQNSPVKIGGQDCHPNEAGAHTGDVSARMLSDCGASAVIVGHSERRTDHAETDALVCAKAEAAYRAMLVAIICVGETAEQRRAGTTLDIVGRQLAGSVPETATASTTVIAYEPVWAIGTGLTPTAADVTEVHAFMRTQLVARFGEAASGMRLLYGGSVKPANAAELLGLPNVNGALVGGASLKADDFLGILSVYSNK
jgi:triosephosphate isomerase (TIM)